MIIRKYNETDEQSWLRCRILSFLNTAYYDNVLNKKEVYENPAIELVAIVDNQVVGLIDVEYEIEAKSICTSKDSLGGMIWHIAVHPDYQRREIGEKLLEAAIQEAKKVDVTYFEAWTRDDRWVQQWYEKMLGKNFAFDNRVEQMLISACQKSNYTTVEMLRSA